MAGMKFNALVDDRPIWPRNPWPAIPRPLSNFYTEVQDQDVTVDGNDGRRYPDPPPTQWSPYGTFESIPYFKEPPASAMKIRRTDFYDASPNPFPNNGQWDKPNGYFASLLRLKPHTSAHPGKNLDASAPGPTMYFKAPPVFSMQTKPIPAVGV